jgi:hypothetical protein
MDHAVDIQLRRWRLSEVINGMPPFVAMHITSDPACCEECRQAGKVGFPEPLDTPHHFTWCCAGHALKRIRLGRLKNQRAVFRQPLGKFRTRPSEGISHPNITTSRAEGKKEAKP